MTMPVLEKTYQFSVNNSLGTFAGEQEMYQRILLLIKNTMKGFGTLPWAVVGSATTAASGMDAVDRWSAYTDLTWNTSGGTHSWIVLKQTGLSSNFQLLFDLVSAGSNQYWKMNVYVSPSAGFTGGTTSARPTATDEVRIRDGGTDNWMASFQGAAPVTKTHIMQSTDGEITRWLVCKGGFVVSHFSIEKAADAVAGWTYPIVVTPIATGSFSEDHTTFAYLNDFAAGYGFVGQNAFRAYWTSEFIVDKTIGEQFNAVANQLSSEWPISPVGIASMTSGLRGRHGRLRDIYFGTTFNENGTTFPAGGTREFALFGDTIVPWNGSTPQIT